MYFRIFARAQAASTVNGSYIAAVGTNASYYHGWSSQLCFYDKAGKMLWNKGGVALPFSFSADTGNVMIQIIKEVKSGAIVSAITVFDKQGNFVGNYSGYTATMSSDGGYIISSSSVERLCFFQMT